MQRLIECVPNFSEGRDPSVIRQITDAISAVDGVRLLNVDPGKATNRTVVTFVGEPDAVVEAAFRAIRTAGDVIDMQLHQGEHPRMGATDVCPLIPISGITMAETAEYARKLAERVGRELDLPVYLYEAAQPDKTRSNLATIRAGEYEGLAQKMARPEWRPDFGPATFDAKRGATVIGARDFLVAFNVNLNTTSTRRANAIAFDVREAGRTLQDAKGKPMLDLNGAPVVQPGTLKAVKAIGWYIAEYGIAQVSMNLVDINVTPVHIAFDEVCRSAQSRGVRVTGGEIVGLIPLSCLLDAGRYFLRKQQRSVGVSEAELVKIAVRSLGLNDVSPFVPEERVIEYLLRDPGESRLVRMTLQEFASETSSESPAPGGGSIAAYVGALGAALGAMVANLSSHKRGWDQRWEEFSDHAERGQEYATELLSLVDEDTRAFMRVMASFGLPKSTEAEKTSRRAAIQAATQGATEVPLRVMEVALASMSVIRTMAESGQESSVSDAGVGALCARSAVMGAYLNVKINAAQLADKAVAAEYVARGAMMEKTAMQVEADILAIVNSKI
ncbi:MAG TPA: glutamate formimidoyltransferase [Gemmatimonadales bacterium]|jgi:glutamate formiminotransferase/formiminotetrahydrofolate cyclodeaminase|nr:glutamate formimidoyltransferase [Gemmatimonadales bacterium]